MSSSRVESRPGQSIAGQDLGLEGSAPLTAEERTALIAELEAELEAAERSVREEGTLSAEEFLKQRADYWAGLSERSGEGTDNSSRRDR